MRYELSFLLFFLCCTLTLHSKNLQKENTKKLLIEHLESTNQIMFKAPYAIKKYEKGKLYLDDFYINQVGLNYTITLANGKVLKLPMMIKDCDGSFLVAKKSMKKKIFKLVCNNCGYEWTGHVFTLRCPKCYSKDFRIERDRII